MVENKNKSVVSQEKRKQYNNAFMNKNKDKIVEQVECPLCKGHYTYYNKSRHNKTARHKSFSNKLIF